MNIEKIEESLQSLVENLSQDTLIYDLLLAYGQPKSSVTRLQKGTYNLLKGTGDILWKKKLFFRAETEKNLYGLIDSKKNDPTITKHKPRFIIVTDFKTLLSIDTKTEDTLDIQLKNLPKYFDFFLPWAGMEKTQLQGENPADIRAAVRMGKLYDIIVQENPPQNESERHALNIFLSRLAFLFLR